MHYPNDSYFHGCRNGGAYLEALGPGVRLQKIDMFRTHLFRIDIALLKLFIITRPYSYSFPQDNNNAVNRFA